MDSIEDDENKYLKIIDYKSGKQKFDFAKIFHGLQMQLIIYIHSMSLAMLSLWLRKLQLLNSMRPSKFTSEPVEMCIRDSYNGDHMSMYGVNAGVPKTPAYPARPLGLR